MSSSGLTQAERLFGQDPRKALAEHDRPLVERMEVLGAEVNGYAAVEAWRICDSLLERERGVSQELLPLLVVPPTLRLYAVFSTLRMLCTLVLERVYLDVLSLDSFWRSREREYTMLSDWALARFKEQELAVKDFPRRGPARFNFDTAVI